MLVSIEEHRQQTPPRQRPGDQAPDYAQDLASRLRNTSEGEVRFDNGSRALYSTDASNYRQTPIGAVIPRTIEDVVNTVAICREFGAPILSRGGGTSLAGQCCNIAVVLDFSKYLNQVISLDPHRKQARVQPGIILDDLRRAAEEHHLTFGPDPATHTHCTIGGMIGNNSCGVHALMAGKTSENIDELEILTYDGLRMRVGATTEDELQRIIGEGGRRGEIYQRLKSLRDRYADLIRQRYPQIPRRVSGYNLDKLLPEAGFHVAQALVGTESTCVTVLEATTRLVSSPPIRVLLLLGFADIYEAADAVPSVLTGNPIGLEGMDCFLVDNIRTLHSRVNMTPLLPEGKAWLIAEFGGETQKEALAQAQQLMDSLQKQRNPPSMKLFSDPAIQRQVWNIRESALGTASFLSGQHAWEGWEDSAVPPDRLGGYLRDLRALYEKYNYQGAFYGHFGQGCLHTRINFDLRTQEGIAIFRRYMEEAADLVVSYGGSLSGEHGDGQARAELLPKMFGPELIAAFNEFKAIWDPNNKMNPHKVVHPYQIDENLRLGPDYHPPQLKTHFQFPEDHGSFADAALRCVGVGKCRRQEEGTMCPSYMVTSEEQHSTRGRARLLFEMLQGEVLDQGWRSEEVKEALDLCLACKGCKHDCPVNVDMATYKSEFLSHYYEGRRRPLSAYAVGRIRQMAELASRMPSVANFFTQAPGISDVMKAVAGIAPQRQLPAFARQTFKAWYEQRPRRNVGQQQVILWPDTFTDYWHPEHGAATVEVLEHLGYHVRVPKAGLCCGRPLYDHGMLDQAKALLREILDTLRPAIRRDVPIVGIEPSCLAVFRDELCNLFPKDEDARRLKANAFTLAEFLEKEDHLSSLPTLQQKAVVHGHCHHKSVIGMNSDRKVLDALGLEYQLLDSGCCGMAGGFGFEKEHYQLSIACGERVLFPKVQMADEGTLILADGFSCQTQIEQATGRRALHLAQVLKIAYQENALPGFDSDMEDFTPVPIKFGATGLAITFFAGAAGLAFALFRKR